MGHGIKLLQNLNCAGHVPEFGVVSVSDPIPPQAEQAPNSKVKANHHRKTGDCAREFGVVSVSDPIPPVAEQAPYSKGDHSCKR